MANFTNHPKAPIGLILRKTMKKLALLSTILLAAASAHAEVRLLVDDHIKVTAINGQEIRHSLLQPLQKEFQLQAGRHVITARYDRMFDLSRGEHDYLKSGNVTITADLADNQTYQLVMPNQPNNYTAAKAFAKAPTLAITQNGQVLTQESVAEQREGFLSGITQSIGGMFNRGDSALSSNQKAIAALNQNTQPQPAQPNARNQDNLDGFMQLWLNASEEERQKIRQWVGN